MDDAFILPAKCLSILQPWTWCIAHGWKPVENRSWKPNNPGLRFRGAVTLHAGKGFDRDGYDFIRSEFPDVPLPEIADFERGGIVGTAVIVDVVTEHPSRWFFGPVGLVMADARPVPFRPCKGALGFFQTPNPAGETGAVDGVGIPAETAAPVAPPLPLFERPAS